MFNFSFILSFLGFLFFWFPTTVALPDVAACRAFELSICAAMCGSAVFSAFFSLFFKPLMGVHPLSIFDKNEIFY
jgi:hypothetical protein